MLKVGSVEIDVASHEVRVGGQRVDIEPKVYALLLYLIQQRARTVSKNELLEQVWPGRIVTDDTLYRAIRLARDVFAESGVPDPAIKTIHRVGYRFVAEVEERDAGGASGSRFIPLLALAGQLDDIDVGGIEGAAKLGGDEPILLEFATAAAALEAALEIQQRLGASGPAMGMHMGAASDEAEMQRYSYSLPRALALAARPGQIFLSAAGFEFTRIHARPDLAWRAHGPYELAGIESIAPLFEVGTVGSDFVAPPDIGDYAKLARTDDLILGWRAAAGQEVPYRSNWVLQDNLGHGGFGEAWMAKHAKTGEKRVFKFCFRADRLKSLQREVTLFRLLNETIGQRQDIARILDWNFDEAPYFVESEYTAHGDLIKWSEQQGGIKAVPLAVRLNLIVQTARALGAAHAVGVLHKDVKPANVLLKQQADADPYAVLADFGIGLITDPDPLVEHSITQLGVTDALAGNVTTARTGTRRYMAPELLEGKPPTLQADIYSLGVVLFQIVVGDFDRVLAPGWERDISDDLLREDIAAMVDGDPEQRLADANEVARRLSRLEERRARRKDEQRQRERLQKEQRRRRILIPSTVVVCLFAIVMAVQSYRIGQQKQRAELEAERAGEVTAFMQSLFDAGNPMFRGGSPPSLQDFLESGANRLRSELATEPLVRATLLTTLGSAFRATDDLIRARELLALAVTDARAAGDWYLEGAAQFELAKVAIELNEIDIARDHLSEGMQAVPLDIDSRGQLLLANFKQAEARLLYLEAKYEQSVELVREALATRRLLLEQDDPRLADAIANLGGNLFELGSDHHAESEALFRESIDLFGKYNPKHYGYQAALANMGIVMETLGRYPEAIEYLERAISLADEIFGGPHPVTAWALQTMGQTQQQVGRRDLALTYLERSLRIRRETRGVHFETALTLRSLADFHLGGGDLERAEALARECVEMRLEAAPAGHVIIDEARHRVGLIMLEQGRLAEAAEVLPNAVEAIVNGLGETHWFSGQALLDLGRLEVALGNSEKAVAHAERGMSILAGNYGESNRKTALATLQLAGVLADAGLTERARVLLEQSWQAAESLAQTAPYRHQQVRALKSRLTAESG